MSLELQVFRLGTVEYGEALAIQERILSLRQQQQIGDCLLLLEHPPVLTIGRNGKRSNILATGSELQAAGITIHDTNRGGDVTYHGPGQLVGYPIMDLNTHGRDIRSFLWRIEEVFIRLLDESYGIQAHREDKQYTGVWVGNEKITAIGIAIKRWVTMHGFAFNINTNLDHFCLITPCGLTDRGVTSVEKLSGETQDFDDWSRRVLHTFAEVFEMDPVVSEKMDLPGEAPDDRS